MKDQKVSIIIPCKTIDSYTEETLEKCKHLDYNNYEIILLPDNEAKRISGVKVIPTGAVPPGKKRNIGLRNSSGKFLAFIDNDAYPKKDWLKKAVKYFENKDVAAVGGPGITPEEDGLMQLAGGNILSSFMVGGISRRFKIKGAFESDDIHSCNFIARRTVLKKVKWNEKYWPGEDTLMCLGIKKLGETMLEAPDVIVYHHRRPLFRKHLKQVSQFGLHRGFFAKRFPENSFRPTYLLPSLILLFLIFGGIFSLFIPLIKNLFITFLAVYAFTALYASLNKDAKLIAPIWLGIILTHLTYGLYFLIGLSKKELRR